MQALSKFNLSIFSKLEAVFFGLRDAFGDDLINRSHHKIVFVVKYTVRLRLKTRQKLPQIT